MLCTHAGSARASRAECHGLYRSRNSEQVYATKINTLSLAAMSSKVPLPPLLFLRRSPASPGPRSGSEGAGASPFSPVSSPPPQLLSSKLSLLFPSVFSRRRAFISPGILLPLIFSSRRPLSALFSHFLFYLVRRPGLLLLLIVPYHVASVPIRLPAIERDGGKRATTDRCTGCLLRDQGAKRRSKRTRAPSSLAFCSLVKLLSSSRRIGD